MDEKLIGVVARAADYNEFDRLLTIITPKGIKSAVIRGVKRQKAKLKSAAMPFAFCEFVLVLKGGYAVVTGASSVEDLFSLTRNSDTLTSASIIMESACAAFTESAQAHFVYMLHRLKDIIAGQNSFMQAIAFLQYIIHNSGYEYEYAVVEGEISTPLKLLSAISRNGANINTDNIDNSLILQTLNKLIINFEDKFDCRINSKKLL